VTADGAAVAEAAAGVVPRLDARGIGKTFPGVVALEDVSVSVRPGEIHALLGENGAGKSTLGKIIGGVYGADAGEIRLDGAPVAGLDEKRAGRLGIGIVHQEGSLVPQLSVAENVFAGRQPTGFLGQIDRKALRDKTRAVLDELGVAIDPEARIAELSPAQGQVVEIAKALSRDLRLLILDEPTAALTLTETQNLFRLVRRLAGRGVAVIYVSHRLAEIFELCHRVTVLKDGRLVGTREVAATSPDELIRMMVGRDVLLARSAEPRRPGPVVIEARHVAAPPFVADASITVRAGEIVCLAGLVGAGRTEFCETLFGARRRTAGDILFRGQPARLAGPWDAMAARIGMVCEDRKQAGLFLDMDLAANISAAVLDQVSRHGQVSRARAEALAEKFVADLGITTPSVRQLVGNLSGGNQQKVLLAKWLALKPEALIVDEPTRGVDVGARSAIYGILRGLAAKGVALLVVSSDLPEVLALSDRIVVMAEGRTVGELEGGTASEEAVLRLATGHAGMGEQAG
jgi:ribose transport system ATP-binding protein/rhamnose transport system ATP-binding protein